MGTDVFVRPVLNSCGDGRIRPSREGEAERPPAPTSNHYEATAQPRPPYPQPLSRGIFNFLPHYDSTL